MTEAEQKLRETAQQMWGSAAMSTRIVFGCLDAILQEHKTEVERLKAENRKLAEALDWTCNVGAQKVRNAALEEAAEFCESASIPMPLEHWRGTKKKLTAEFSVRLAERIRALKSKEDSNA